MSRENPWRAQGSQNERKPNPPPADHTIWIVIVLLVISLFTCRAYGQERCPNGAYILPHTAAHVCPSGSLACYDAASNAVKVLRGGEKHIPHECEHAEGMNHTPWVAIHGMYCAIVLEAGNTQWKPGHVMCNDGNYFLQTDQRMRKWVYELSGRYFQS